MASRVHGPRAILAAVSTVAGLAAVVVLALPTAAGGAPAWVRVGTGATQGISGLTAATSGWVIARDNKSAGQDRIALLGTDDRVTDVTWPGTAPQDLESIAAVPGVAGRYVTCTSARACFVIDLAGTSLTVARTFTLAVGGKQNEAFALARMPSGATVALWADRGSAATPGALHAARLDLTTWKFGAVTTAKVKVPWPTGPVRHVSDAAVAGGHVIITSAADHGNKGPFDSAVYDVGSLTLRQARVTFTLHAPTELARFPGHKVEGLACGTAGQHDLVGTDDESLGGFITTADVC